MTDLAAWIAPIATTIAAIMTAANLGTRVTGWGFVVFLVGSLAWSAYAIGTGQHGLLWQNLFLTLVNLVGVWRWLGRQAKLDQGARQASEASAVAPDPTLFPASTLTGGAITGRDGTLGTAVDAMIRCTDGGIAYVVLSEGGVAGVGETLRVLPWGRLSLDTGGIHADLAAEDLASLQTTDRGAWPERTSGAANSKLD